MESGGWDDTSGRRVNRLCTARASKYSFCAVPREEAALHLVDAPSDVLSLERAEPAATMLGIPVVLRPPGTASDDAT